MPRYGLSVFFSWLTNLRSTVMEPVYLGVYEDREVRKMTEKDALEAHEGVLDGYLEVLRITVSESGLAVHFMNYDNEETVEWLELGASTD